MSHSTNQKHSDLLNTQNTGAEKAHKEPYSEVITRTPVEHTPFEIIGNEEHGFFPALGKYKLTEAQPTIEKAKEQLVIEQWNIIVNTIAIFQELAEKKAH